MHNFDNQTIFETTAATQTKVLSPQSFIEVEKVISSQPSKIHPIHAHRHYEIRQLDPLKKYSNIAFNTLFSYYLFSIGKLEEDTENIVEHKADFVFS